MSKKRKHSILNNTRIVMNLFSFLEIADLVQMRNLNSCSKLISNHFIKMNINRDKSKYRNLVCQNENNAPTQQLASTNNNSTSSSSSSNHDNSSSVAQLRMKFLQLWNIYSNKDSIEKVNYYDSDLSLLIKILLHLMSNVKKGLEFNFIPKDGGLLFSQPTNLLHNHSDGHASLLSSSYYHNVFILGRDDDGHPDLDQDHENVPIYIQEFLRNESIWKLLAKLSGYNLSNAELSSESDGIFEYYLWPEKMDDPKHSIIDQNVVEDILSKMARMRSLDPTTRKQISVLMNKSSKAELTFYSNNGNVVNKSNIHLVIRDDYFQDGDDDHNDDDFDDDGGGRHRYRHHKPRCENSDFFKDDITNKKNKTKNKHRSHLPFINSQLSSTILLWILNFIKLQKQLPRLKQLPPNHGKKTTPSRNQTSRHNTLHNHSYYHTNNNQPPPPNDINTTPPPIPATLSTSRYYSRLNSINQHERAAATATTRVGIDKNHFSNSHLGDIPETFGKLCNIIHSQENLLVELKQILNTIKS